MRQQRLFFDLLFIIGVLVISEQMEQSCFIEIMHLMQLLVGVQGQTLLNFLKLAIVLVLVQALTMAMILA
jgi:hypothetical protein